jgi:hypothetical protein
MKTWIDEINEMDDDLIESIPDSALMIADTKRVVLIVYVMMAVRYEMPKLIFKDQNLLRELIKKAELQQDKFYCFFTQLDSAMD